MAKFEKTFVDFSLILILIFGFIMAIRVTAGGSEDSWICKNGQWIKHGNPSTEMPVEICK